MAAIRDNIVAQMVTHINTITVATSYTLSAYDAMPEPSVSRPAVWIQTDPVGGDVATNRLDRTMRVILQVEGPRTVVNEALEVLAAYYEDATKYAALTALGVVDFEVDFSSWYDAVATPGGNCQGSIAIDMRYRKSF